MRPTTVITVLLLLVVLATGTRWLLCRTGVVPERVDALKDAVALRIAYTVRGDTKYLRISDPAEVRRLLETLQDGWDHPQPTFGSRSHRFFNSSSRPTDPPVAG